MPFAGGTYGWERLKKTSCTLCPPGGALPSGSPRRHGEAPYEVPRDEGVDTRSGSPTSQPDRAPLEMAGVGCGVPSGPGL